MRNTCTDPAFSDPRSAVTVNGKPALTGQVAAREAKGEQVTAAGLPPCVSDSAAFITEDCVQPPALPG